MYRNRQFLCVQLLSLPRLSLNLIGFSRKVCARVQAKQPHLAVLAPQTLWSGSIQYSWLSWFLRVLLVGCSGSSRLSDLGQFTVPSCPGSSKVLQGGALMVMALWLTDEPSMSLLFCTISGAWPFGGESLALQSPCRDLILFGALLKPFCEKQTYQLRPSFYTAWLPLDVWFPDRTLTPSVALPAPWPMHAV